MRRLDSPLVRGLSASPGARRFWRNPYLLAMSCTVLLTGLAIDQFRAALLAEYSTQQLLNSATTISQRLSALEWQAVAEGSVSATVERERREANEALTRTLRQLTPEAGIVQSPAEQARTAQFGATQSGAALAPSAATAGAAHPAPAGHDLQAASAPPLQVAAHLLRRFQQAVNARFASLERGDLEREEPQPELLFEQLEVALRDAERQTLLNTRRTETLTRFGSLGLVALALGATLVLARASERAARRAQELELERDQFRHQSEQDTLTGLLNRGGLLRRYLALPPGRPFAAIMLDLNNLKFINDIGGHAQGDAHIRAVTQHLASWMPAGALCCRWGGDEFVVLLPGTTPEAARLLGTGAAQSYPQTNGMPAFSCGVAALRTGEPLERALTLADADMYEQKDQARAGLARSLPVSTAEEFVARLERITEVSEVFRAALPMARDLLGFEAVCAFEVRGDGVHETVFLSAPGLPTPRAEGGPVSGGGIVAQVIRSGQSMWSHDYPGDARFQPGPGTPGMKSCAVSPVRHRGEVVGALGLAHLSSWRPITPQVRSVMDCLVLHLSNLLERQQVVAEVQSALEGGQKALGIALELRDLETAGHTERVVQLAEALGRELGLGTAELRVLRQGAYLHDLGKLAIPDTVLLKPGRLDDAERALMQTHAGRGAEVAAYIPGLPRGVLEVIRSHHERWDGRGYPDALAGEAIPLLARVFSVADVYDALTSVRPYKDAWTPGAALQEIEQQAGRQFDPAVVRAFVQLRGAAPAVIGWTGSRADPGLQAR